MSEYLQRAPVEYTAPQAMPVYAGQFDYSTLLDRVIRHIAPWKVWEYPGRVPLICSIVGGFTRETVRAWRKCRNMPTADTLRRLRDHLDAKAREAAGLRDELDLLIASRPVRKPSGFEVSRARPKP